MHGLWEQFHKAIVPMLHLQQNVLQLRLVDPARLDCSANCTEGLPHGDWGMTPYLIRVVCKCKIRSKGLLRRVVDNAASESFCWMESLVTGTLNRTVCKGYGWRAMMAMPFASSLWDLNSVKISYLWSVSITLPCSFSSVTLRQKNKRVHWTLPCFSYICWWDQQASGKLAKLSDAIFASRHANVSSLWRLLLFVFLKSPHLWVKLQDEMMTALACSCIHQRWLSDAVLIKLPWLLCPEEAAGWQSERTKLDNESILKYAQDQSQCLSLVLASTFIWLQANCCSFVILRANISTRLTKSEINDTVHPELLNTL